MAWSKNASHLLMGTGRAQWHVRQVRECHVSDATSFPYLSWVTKSCGPEWTAFLPPKLINRGPNSGLSFGLIRNGHTQYSYIAGYFWSTMTWMESERVQWECYHIFSYILWASKSCWTQWMGFLPPHHFIQSPQQWSQIWLDEKWPSNAWCFWSTMSWVAGVRVIWEYCCIISAKAVIHNRWSFFHQKTLHPTPTSRVVSVLAWSEMAIHCWVHLKHNDMVVRRESYTGRVLPHRFHTDRDSTKGCESQCVAFLPPKHTIQRFQQASQIWLDQKLPRIHCCFAVL